MPMTDFEILQAWNEAADKREQVQILADRNLTTVWHMALKLKELNAPGLDMRWFNQLNPERKNKTQKPEPTEADTEAAAPKSEAEFYPSRMQLIDWFCGDLRGSAAYIVGRIVDSLYDARETGDATELIRFILRLREAKE